VTLHRTCCAPLLGAALALGALAPTSRAQEQPKVNLKYLSSFGMGSGDTGGQTLRSLRIPLSYWVRPVEERSWGLRFRVPITFGVTHFDLGDTVPFDNLKALTVLPTVDVHIPLDDAWTLRPFVGVGGGWEFETGRSAWLGTAGVIAEAYRPYRPWAVHYGSALRYDWDMNSDGTGFDDFGRVELMLELRRELGASVRRHALEPGVYGMAYLYWDQLEIDGGSAGKFELHDEYELGLSVGTLPDIKVLGIGLPRVFLGWRFGRNVQGVRLTFGSLL
jgi:hypothetical protein